jgi:Tfp pilus assembly protein PilF
MNAGNLYRDTDSQLAVQYYQKALQKDAKSAETLNNLAMILSRRPETYQQAYQLFEKSLAQRYKNAEAHNNFALLLTRMNRVDEAISHLRIAISINPQFKTAINNLQILEKDSLRNK